MSQTIIVKTVKDEKSGLSISEKEYVAVESVNTLWKKPVFKFKTEDGDEAVLKERLGVKLPGKTGQVVVYTQK